MSELFMSVYLMRLLIASPFYKFGLFIALLITFDFQLRFHRQKENNHCIQRIILLRNECVRREKVAIFFSINTRNFEAICPQINWTGSFKPNVNNCAFNENKFSGSMNLAQKYRYNSKNTSTWFFFSRFHASFSESINGEKWNRLFRIRAKLA